MPLVRKLATVGGATLLSRLLGFARDVAIAAILGAGVLSDAYFAALQIPNFFRRLLAEGALNAAFVPMWLRRRDESGAAARRFSEEVLGATAIALLVVALLCEILAPQIVSALAPGFGADGERHHLAALFLRVSAMYIPIAGVVAVLASMLHARGRVGAVAFGGVAFNCVMLAVLGIAVFADTPPSSQVVTLLSASIALAGLAQLAIVGFALLRLREARVFPRLPVSPQARQFFARAVPGVVAAGIPQIAIIAGAMVASSSQAAMSWLYYANRLYELPLGVLSVAIASVLAPQIAASRRINERSAFAAAQSRAFEIGMGLALPAAAGLVLLAPEIATVLFERGAFTARDSAAVASALAAISAGLPGHVLEKIFGAICFAHEDTRTPLFAALAGLASAVLGAILLFPAHGHVGVAAAIGIAGWVGAAILGGILIQRRWLKVDAGASRTLPRIVIATVIMGTGIAAAQAWIGAASPSPSVHAGRLALLVAGGLVLYMSALRAFRVAQMGEWLEALRSRP